MHSSCSLLEFLTQNLRTLKNNTYQKPGGPNFAQISARLNTLFRYENICQIHAFLAAHAECTGATFW